MINAQLKLIVPVFVPSNNVYKILSTVEYTVNLPSIEIETNQSIEQLIAVLLSRYFKDTTGVTPKLVDVENTDSSLTIYYLCFINYETQIINGVLKNIDVNTDRFPINATKTLALLV
jgi:hypothetical protein